MARLLTSKDSILLALSIFGDIFDEVRTAGGVVGSAYKNVYGLTPERFKKSNYYGSISRMLKCGQIEKSLDKDEVVIKITAEGKSDLVRKFPLLKLQNKKWDGRFRVVIFDIPETSKYRRNILRNKLKELGFGMMQKSVWISPHAFEDDIRDVIRSYDLNDLAHVFVSESYSRSDALRLAEATWHLKRLNEAYLGLISSIDNKIEAKKYADWYFQIIMTDPFLPKELLPDNWLGDKARSIFKNLATR